MGSRASFVGYLRHMIRHRTRETRRSTTTIFYGDAMCLIDAQKGRPKPCRRARNLGFANLSGAKRSS